MRLQFPSIFAPIALLFCLTACTQNAPAPQSFSRTTAALSESRGYFVIAQDMAQNTMKHSDPIGQALLGQVIAAIKLGFKQLDIADAQNAKSAAAYASVASDDAKTHDDLKAERAHWTGYKLRMLGRITLILLIVGAFLAVLLLIAGFGVISGIIGPMAGAGLFGKIINTILSLGVNLAHAVGQYIGQAVTVGHKVIAAEKTIAMSPDPAAGTQGAPLAP